MPSDVDLEDLTDAHQEAVEQLQDAGYTSLQSIAVASASELSETADLGESSAVDIIQAAREAADIGGFETGLTAFESQTAVNNISWGVDNVDNLLDGGVETQSLTEVCGEFGAGKSQVIHQLSVNVQLPAEHGGLEGSAIVIDSEDSFRPERIEQIVKGYGDEVLEDTMVLHGVAEKGEASVTDEAMVEALIESVLDKIHVAKAFNSNHQVLLAEKAREIANENQNKRFPVRLVAVDSVTAHFRAESVGREEHAERQQKLNKHLHDLTRVGNLYNTAVVVTDRVTSNPDSFFGDPTQPIGEDILGHTSTFRIHLRKSTGNKRIVKLVHGPDTSTGEAFIQLTQGGIKSVPTDFEATDNSVEHDSADGSEDPQVGPRNPDTDPLPVINNNTEYFALLYALGETTNSARLQRHDRLSTIKPEGRDIDTDLDLVQSFVRDGDITQPLADDFAEELARQRIQEVTSESPVVDPDVEDVKQALKQMILEPV